MYGYIKGIIKEIESNYIIIDNNDIVKDLNRIGRALDKTLIIDNMAQNYKFQKNNGILIKSIW